MSFFGAIFGQFVDVIAWTDDSSNTLVWRFQRHNNEIKYGAKLTVREGQAAVFVHEGVLADVFPPGLYKLKTNNLPILSTLQHWDHGFESPFKSEVYFVSTRQFTDLKWGTKNPVMLRDPEFGAVRLRMYGAYALRVIEPGVFLREIVGTDGRFTTEEIAGQLRSIIVSRASNAIATSRIPVLDLAANTDDLGEFVRKRVQPEMAEYGVEVTKLLIENVSLPPVVEAALDRRASMGVVGDLRRYAQFQAAEAARAAAENPSGGAGAGVGAGIGMGVGAAMGREMAREMARGGDPVGEIVGSRSGSTAGPVAGPWGAPPPVSAPPPEPALWHVAVDGRAEGPITRRTLAEWIAQDRIGRETLVWRKGFENWTALTDAGELAELLPATPPPLPGS